MLVLLMGCLKITYTTGAEIERPPNHEEWHHRFAYGMVEVPGPFDASQVCPNGVTQVRTELSAANIVTASAVDAAGQELGVDASGAYNPSTIYVWCAP